MCTHAHTTKPVHVYHASGGMFSLFFSARDTSRAGNCGVDGESIYMLLETFKCGVRICLHSCDPNKDCPCVKACVKSPVSSVESMPLEPCLNPYMLMVGF